MTTNLNAKGDNGQHKLLLPLSYGLSSSVLLNALSARIERQLSKPNTRTPYELHILVVEPPTVSPLSSYEEHLETVRKVFPRHSYTQIPLHSIFEYDSEIREVIPQFVESGFVDDASLSDKERLDAFRSSISTATSKADVDGILISRLIVACAKRLGYHAVLWGDSDSRLAAKTLANVAKGRGSSLTWQLSDGMSPWGVEFYFPLRDLFNSELRSYVDLKPELKDIIVPDVPLSENTPTKNLSIDQLMMRYVDTQGEKYPGVMANVTRMVTKLDREPVSIDNPRCVFCKAFTGDHGNATSNVTDASVLGGTESSQLCYGCARSKPELAS